ncbi:MAG: rhomboid family intramembrane serine protease [Armatimonadota bacterium]
MFFLLPYGTDRRINRIPVVTYTLVAGNIALFILFLKFDRGLVLTQFGLNPSEPRFLQIISSMFIHASAMHLVWNVLFLWLFGPNVEDALGYAKYAGLYLGSGIAASLLHLSMSRAFIPGAEAIPVVGASGAIAGVLGAFAVRFYKTGVRVFWVVGILIYPLRWGTLTVSAMAGLGAWFAYQFLGGVISVTYPLFSEQTHRLLLLLFGSSIAYWSHIGGMLFGALAALALRMGLAGTKEYLSEDARSSLASGTTWDAAEHYRALLAHEPENPEVHANLAKTYALQHDPERSVEHYEKSVQLHIKQGRCDKAVETFAELRRYYRNARLELRSEYQLAKYLADTDCYGPALQMLLDIVATYPDSPEAEVSLMKAGDLYLNKLANKSEALRCYGRFIAEYPHSPWRHTVEKSARLAKH